MFTLVRCQRSEARAARKTSTVHGMRTRLPQLLYVNAIYWSVYINGTADGVMYTLLGHLNSFYSSQ